ncbi:exportin-7-like [Zophobas morio]|uniref:exportin-7-like n=1 Tax=Zophobas morio TaxID=2755281 RepID=UPI003083AA97
MAASILSTRPVTITSPKSESMDGELACTVLRLMSIAADMQTSCEPLEIAFLTYLTNFSKAFIGTPVLRTSKLFSLLAESLNLPDQLTVLDAFVNKILKNLKVFFNNKTIIKETLKTFTELSMGYSFGHMLVKLDTIQYLLRNHAESLEFFSFPQRLNLRTDYYSALSRILSTYIDCEAENDMLEYFMLTFDRAFQNLCSIFQPRDYSLLKNDNSVKSTVIEVARSLTGLLVVTENKEMFMCYFDYIFPHYTNVLQEAMNIWMDDVDVTFPILKFFGELVSNRKPRIEFEVTSVNGILLFRQLSQIISGFVAFLLSSQFSNDSSQESQKNRYRGVLYSINILVHTLGAKFVNFGAFKLYGDEALDKVLNVFYQVISTFQLDWILSFNKLAKAYYSLVEVLAADHIYYLATLDSNAFHYFINSISEGFALMGRSSSNDELAVKCCHALDSLISHAVKCLKKKTNQVDTGLILAIESCKELLVQMLKVMLNAVIFEECKIYWSLSRPMLAIIILNKKYFDEAKNYVIEQQSNERQPMFHKLFDELMNGLDGSLSQRNRNQFNKNINSFRRDVTNFTKTAPPEEEGAIIGESDSIMIF